MIKEVFAFELADLAKYDWNSFLDPESATDIRNFPVAFAKKIEEYRKVEDPIGCNIAWFFWLLSRLETRVYSQNQEYTPSIDVGVGRSLTVFDFDAEDLDILRDIYTNASNIILKCRVGDILWLRFHDPSIAQETIENYLSIINEDDYPTKGLDYNHTIHRCLVTARQMKNTEYIDKLSKLMQSLIDKHCDITNKASSIYLLQHCLELNVNVTIENAERLDKLSKDFKTAREYHLAKMAASVAIDFFRYLKNEDETHNCQIFIADCLKDEAFGFLVPGKEDYFNACRLLELAIQAYRNAKADKTLINSLIATFNQTRVKIPEQMQVYRHEINIGGYVQSINSRLSGLSLEESIKYMTYGIGLIDLDKLEAQVKELSKEFLFTYLFPTAHYFSDGRRTGVTPGVLGAEDEEKAVKMRMFIDAHYEWVCRAFALIEPARKTILQNHHPSKFDLAYLVLNNPFVPRGHESIFLEGIHAGFWGNYIQAAHLLIPQIENSIRFALINYGVNVTKLLSDHTQELVMLDNLLRLEETTEVFGKQYVFELLGLVCKQETYNLRNNICHGLITDGLCQDISVINTWWLVLRIIMSPHMSAIPDLT